MARVREAIIFMLVASSPGMLSAGGSFGDNAIVVSTVTADVISVSSLTNVDSVKFSDGFMLTSTGVLNISNLSVATSTIYDYLTSTAANLAAIGGTINNPVNPVDWNKLKGVPDSLATGNGLITIYSDGVVQGNATTVNFTDAISATCSGSTCTATATPGEGGGGGGGGVWISSTAWQYNQPVTTMVFTGVFIDSVTYENGVATISVSGLPFYLFTATSDARGSELQGALSTSGVLMSKVLTSFSTTSVAIDFLKAFTSTASVDIDKYKAFSATASAKINNLHTYLSTAGAIDVAIISSITALATRLDDSTGAIRTTFNNFSSTVSGRINGLQTALSTHTSGMAAFISTWNAFNTFNSTGQVLIFDLGVATSNVLALLKSTAANLAAPGTINTAGNPVSWTKLIGVPAAFADGTDDGAGGAGGGDNFGSHKATQAADMGNFAVIKASSVEVDGTGDSIFSSNVSHSSFTIYNVQELVMHKSTVTWEIPTGDPAGKTRPAIQGGPSFYLIGSTRPSSSAVAGSVSTMSVTVSTHTFYKVIFFSSGVSTSADYLLFFNDSLNKSKTVRYAFGRDCGAAASSTTALGGLLYGAGTIVSRMGEFNIFDGNETQIFASGTYGTAGSLTATAPVSCNGALYYENSNEPVNKIALSCWAAGCVFRNGSYINVYAQD